MVTKPQAMWPQGLRALVPLMPLRSCPGGRLAISLGPQTNKKALPRRNIFF